MEFGNDPSSNYREFKFSSINYDELAYKSAVSLLSDNEYIIKKAAEYDNGIKNEYNVSYITNMGNIIYINGRGENIIFGNLPRIGCPNFTKNNTCLHNKIIDSIVEYDFMIKFNKNCHCTNIFNQLKNVISSTQTSTQKSHNDL